MDNLREHIDMNMDSHMVANIFAEHVVQFINNELDTITDETWDAIADNFKSIILTSYKNEGDMCVEDIEYLQENIDGVCIKQIFQIKGDEEYQLLKSYIQGMLDKYRMLLFIISFMIQRNTLHSIFTDINVSIANLILTQDVDKIVKMFINVDEENEENEENEYEEEGEIYFSIPVAEAILMAVYTNIQSIMSPDLNENDKSALRKTQNI